MIISAIIIILVVGMSEVNISTSSQSLNRNSNEIIRYVADACLEESIYRIENDTTYTTESLSFDNDASCDISVSGTYIDINVSYLNYSQNFQAEFSITQIGQANNVNLLKWTKI